MKFSEKTRETLTHFATQGENFVFKVGRKQAMMTDNKSRMVEVDIDEEIPLEVGIFDFKKFVTCMKSFNDPEFLFDEKCITLSEGKIEAKFTVTSLDLLKYPAKTPSFVGNGVQLLLEEDIVGRILKYIKVMDCKHLIIESLGGRVVLKVQKSPKSNEDRMEIDLGLCDQDFNLSLNVAGLNLLVDSYNLLLSDKKILKLKSTSKEVCYFLAVDSVSYSRCEISSV